MKQMTKMASVLFAGAAILLSGCCRTGSQSDVVNPLNERDGSFYINGYINPLRMAGDAWQGGDALGVFALNKDQNTPFGNFANVKYTTPDVSGKFVAANGGIVLKGQETADIVAYYPYAEVGADMLYKVNVADQSDLSKIDLLRGKGTATAASEEVPMAFNHRLAMLKLTIEGESLNTVTASVEGLKTDATYNVATDELTPGTTVGTTTATMKESTITMILVPEQELKTIKFNIDGKEATHTFDTAISMKKGYVYTLTFKVAKSEVATTLKLNSTNINPWTEGITDNTPIDLAIAEGGDTTEPGTEPGTTEPDTPTPGTEDPQPSAANLLFPGADFEDWNAFTGSLNKFGLTKTEMSTNGRTGNAAHFTGVMGSKNGFFFTVEDKTFDKPIKSISFYLKGKVDGGKSLSVNVYEKGKPNSFKAFNVGTLSTEDVVLSPEGQNAYDGSIDTNDKWVKVTLDCSSFEAGPETQFGNLIAFKFGRSGNYNLLLDDVTFE